MLPDKDIRNAIQLHIWVSKYQEQKLTVEATLSYAIDTQILSLRVYKNGQRIGRSNEDQLYSEYEMDSEVRIISMGEKDEEFKVMVKEAKEICDTWVNNTHDN